MTTIRTTQHKFRTVFFIVILLSIFYACEEEISNGEIPANLRVFNEWATDNEESNLAEITSGTLISTREELEGITANGEYYLTANIDLGTEEWTPLFSGQAPFTGTLHGNGYIIYNLNINAPNRAYQGLFAALRGATIKNLGIGVRALHAYAAAGALAGHAENGTATLTLENIIVGGVVPDSQITVREAVDIGIANIQTAYSYVGGVLGALESGTARMLINEGLAVMATGAFSDHGRVGGVVGYNTGNISNSRSSGMVSANGGQAVGGLVGYNAGDVQGSASGDVSSVSGLYVGGLVGYNLSGVRGFASGDVSTDSGDYIGGFVGSSFNGTTYGSANGDVSSDSGSYVGGFAGWNTVGTVYGSASGDVSTQSGKNVGGFVGYNGEGTVHGVASGTVSVLLFDGQSWTGGFVGSNNSETMEGYSTGWVMVMEDTTQPTQNEEGNTPEINIRVGAAAGISVKIGAAGTLPTPLALDKVYYNSTGGDHVGSIGIAPIEPINMENDTDSGSRGTNGIGTGIDDIANATATNMSLTEGEAVGEWTFTAGEWPKINLPADVTDYMDYTTSLPQPGNFID